MKDDKDAQSLVTTEETPTEEERPIPEACP